MTTPEIKTVNQGGVRFYINPQTNERAPGVTSVTNMIPKQHYLGPWNAKMAATFAVDNIGAVVNLLVNGERQAAINMIKGHARRDTGQAAEAGDAVHALTEKMMLGEKIKRQPLELKPYQKWIGEFLDQAQPEVVYLEQSVWGYYGDHPYAGSFDWLARIDGKLILGDTKTTRSGVHDDVALQLNAYAHAKELIYPDDDFVPMPEVEGLAVLHLRPEGWKLVPVRLGDDIFDVFGSLLNGAYQWDREIRHGVIGDNLLSGGND